MKIETLLAQAGSRWDSRTGAVSMPIYQVATFRHPALGKSTGYDYSRTLNPTREALENAIAESEGGARALAFSSGLAAIDAILHLFQPGDELIVTEDLYGGTFRLFDKIYSSYGIHVTYIDTTDLNHLQQILESRTIKGVFVEVPTNPMLKVADIAAIAAACHKAGALLILDNTFPTFYLLRGFELGADLIVYSGTKYLAGHNDVVAGIVVARSREMADRIAFFQNAIGAILGPQDSWLLLRGLKTLSVRLNQQEANARQIAKWLTRHARVAKVFYPGLESHPGHMTMKKQARGFGAMISFEVQQPDQIPAILEKVKVFLFAESLGGVESLITFPAVQTHADIQAETRDRLGINNRLLRLSIGIEDAEDLIQDLDSVL